MYLSGDILVDSPVHLAMGKDGDIETRIPARASSAGLGSAAHQLRYFGASFELCCQILAEALRIIRTAIGGALGWALLLWQLVKSYRDIRPYYKLLKALPRPVVLSPREAIA